MSEAIPGVTVSLRELVMMRALAVNAKLGGGKYTGGSGAGSHRSVLHGRGLEFDEVRAYQAGDDIRTIDWRVTARRGKPHTKLYREERERPVYLVVDLQPGMFFGTRRQFKSVLVSRIAALAAWTASMAGDRVGGVVLSGKKCSVIPPRSRNAGVLALLNNLVSQQPSSPEDLQKGRIDEGVARLRHIVNPGSVILILSDFVDLGEDGKKTIVSLTRKNDVFAGFAYDPLEAGPPDSGRYRFGTPASQVMVDTSDIAVKRIWRKGFALRLEFIQELSRRSAMSFAAISTHADAVQAFQSHFRFSPRKYS